MFLGEYTYTIDEKGRLTIPAKYRRELATGLVITKGIDRCLVIYPMGEWEQLKERVARLPLTSREARGFRRLLFSGANDTVPDSQGRINIPQSLREYAGLDGQAIIAGCDAYIEIWSPGNWQEMKEWVDKTGQEEQWASLNI